MSLSSVWKEGIRTARIMVRVVPIGAMILGSSPLRAQEVQPAPTPVEDHARAVECLTLAIAYEAGYESSEGQQAVAEVVLNRLRNGAFPKTVCDVVFAGSKRRTGCQFTFTCDGSLYRRLPGRIMLVARMVAEDALAGRTPSRVPGATHYHAAYVKPYWAPKLVRVGKIGAHIFYQAPGGNAVGSPGAAAVAEAGGDAVAAIPPNPAAKSDRAATAFAPWGLAAATAPER